MKILSNKQYKELKWFAEHGVYDCFGHKKDFFRIICLYYGMSNILQQREFLQVRGHDTEAMKLVIPNTKLFGLELEFGNVPSATVMLKESNETNNNRL